MKTTISFLAFRLSSMTDDSITVGLFYSDEDGKVTLFVSEERLKLLKKIIPRPLFLSFNRMIRTYQKYNLTHSDILHQYKCHQTGIIKVTQPSLFLGNLEAAETTFIKYIKDNYKTIYEYHEN